MAGGLKQRWYPGWTMVAIAFSLIFFASVAPSAALPLVYGEVIKEFGWTRTQATMIYTFKQIATSVLALFVVGPMTDRFGLRVVAAALCIATGLGMISMLFVTSLPTYYLSGLLFGMGGVGIVIPAKLLVTRWFSRNLGVATGIALLALSMGGSLFPLAMTALIGPLGWRGAFASLSIGLWLVALPLFVFCARTDPSAEETLREVSTRTDDPDLSTKLAAAEPTERLGQLLRSRTFLCIAGGVFLTGMINAGLVQHFVLLLTAAGLTAPVAASCLSISYVVGLGAKVVAGRIYDRFHTRGFAAWDIFYALAISSALFIGGVPTAMLFGALIGFAQGGLILQTSVISRQCFGRRHLNRLLPVLSGIFNVGAAFGPLSLSWSADHAGSYAPGIVFFAVSAAISSLLLLGVRPLYVERLRALGL